MAEQSEIPKPSPYGGNPQALCQKARPADCDEIAALATEALAEKAVQRGGRLLLSTQFPGGLTSAELAAATADERKGIWVARLSDAAVGFALAELQKLANGGLIVRARALYVLKEARGVGVGESLMKAVLDWAARSGAEGVDSVALPGDRATKNFFEQFGLKARAILVHRSLKE